MLNRSLGYYPIVVSAKGNTGTGTAGATGNPGTPILYRASQSVYNTTTLEEKDFSYAVPANTLSADGDGLEVLFFANTNVYASYPLTPLPKIYIKVAGATVAKTLPASADYAFPLIDAASTAGQLIMRLYRLSATTITIEWEFKVSYQTVGAPGNIELDYSQDSITVSSLVSNTLLLEACVIGDSPSAVRGKSFEVKLIKKTV